MNLMGPDAQPCRRFIQQNSDRGPVVPCRPRNTTRGEPYPPLVHTRLSFLAASAVRAVSGDQGMVNWVVAKCAEQFEVENASTLYVPDW